MSDIGRSSNAVNRHARLDGGEHDVGDHAEHQVQFTGSGWQYFKLCFWTIALAIITFGIYDAWGTVHRRRYMLGHTVYAGHSFDYHARPMTILIGRLIAMGCLAIFILLNIFVPILSILTTPLFIVLIPYLVIRSLAFNARNTSYRNIRFNHEGRYGPAFTAFVFAPFLSVLTIGILAPWALKLRSKFALNNLSFGTLKFSMNAGAGAFIKPVVILALGYLVFAGLTFLVYQELANVAALGDDPAPEDVIRFSVVSTFGIYLAFGFLVFCGFLAKAAYRNRIISNTEMEGGDLGLKNGSILIERIWLV